MQTKNEGGNNNMVSAGVSILIALVTMLVGVFLGYKILTFKEEKAIGMNKNILLIPVAILIGVGVAQFGLLSGLGIQKPFAVAGELAAGDVVEEELPIAETGVDLGDAGEEIAPVVTGVLPPCPGISAVTVTFSSHNAYKAGSEASGSTYKHRVFQKNGDGTWLDLSTFSEDGTKSLAGKTTLRVLFRFNETSTDGSGNETYARMVTKTIGCEDYPFDEAVYDTGDSPTISIWREDSELMASGTQEDVTASSEYQWVVRVKADNDECFGNPIHPGKGNVMCWRFNTTTGSGFELSTIDTNIPLETASKPNDLTAVAGKDEDCYYFDVVCDNAQKDYNVLFKTAATAPVDASDDSVYLFDTSIDLDADFLFAKPIIYSYQDEDKYDLGITSIPSQTYYVT